MANTTPGNQRKFDLEERTAKFGEAIIRFCKSMRQDAISAPLIGQLVRCGTSVGANYGEANDAESKKDFRHKIALCRKESRESKHWLRMLAVAISDSKPDGRRLWPEAKELNMIFSAILKSRKDS